jgi:MerR family mercuric resistance operon transcriptional regulator
MRIGELARSVDVNVETVRYYQRIGLLELPEKPYGGIR